ncbi:MAG: hypothetical protein JWQ23_2839 [Herminiimonas sp.]|nr:hypothetical protein [Herminiimonas sp.]
MHDAAVPAEQRKPRIGNLKALQFESSESERSALKGVESEDRRTLKKQAPKTKKAPQDLLIHRDGRRRIQLQRKR